MSNELGITYTERTDSELKQLELLGGVLGLEIGRLGGVEGKDSLPRRRERAGILQRDGNEVRGGDVGLYLLQGLDEVGLRDLLHEPLFGKLGAETASL